MRTALAEPAERGRLDIHPAGLRKIVEHAADGVPGTLRNERRLAGIDVGESGARTALAAYRRNAVCRSYLGSA